MAVKKAVFRDSQGDAIYFETSADKVSGLAAVATSNSYNDLDNKPTIPDTSTLMPKSGGDFSGNVNMVVGGTTKASIDTNGYVTGTWLRTTNATEFPAGQSSQGIAILNGGWIYYRTLANLKDDLGIGNIEALLTAINSGGGV